MTDNQPNMRSYKIELFLLSAVALYLELLVIRWMSCDVRAFTVFKTFPLVTCYVGLGLGFALMSDRSFRLAALAVLQFVGILRLVEWMKCSDWMFPSVSVFAWANVDALGSSLWLYIAMFILMLVLLLMGPFALMACLGSRLGVLFDSMKPLSAYCINIGGSIAGSLIFGLVSFLELPPFILLIPASLPVFYYVKKKAGNIWLPLIPLVVSVLVAAWGTIRTGEFGTYWSPYQRLDVMQINQEEKRKDLGINIGTNRNFYQYAINLSDDAMNYKGWTPNTTKLLQESLVNYNLPYKFKSPKNVLILGAGSGNDVASALRHNAEHVDAVDIDPIILRLGKLYHPEHPYDSSKVNPICDDARHFLNKTKSTYDLIIFAGLDSHAVTGEGASIRLDNYVYTVQSIRSALSHLNKEDGLIVLSFCKCKDWLSERLKDTIVEACGYQPLVLIDPTNPTRQWEIFLIGPMVQKGIATMPADLAPIQPEKLPPLEKNRILTDDWPYLYVSPVAIDGPYLLVVAIVIGLSTFAARRALFSKSGGKMWQMFFLGSAFILLELQAITRLSLIYGSTWLTASIVINGVLIMILAANVMIIRFEKAIISKQSLMYALLAVALLVSYALPVQQLLAIPVEYVGAAIATFFTLLPVLMAGLIFGTAFSQTKQASKALAFNLFGAVIGAMLEYLSNYIGINGLILVALALYGFSFIGFKWPSSTAESTGESGGAAMSVTD